MLEQKKKRKKYLLYRLHQGQGQTTSLITTVQVVSVTWVRKKAPISELMAGLLLWSPDRYTQHVSQVLAHHLPGAEKMVREWKREQGEVEGNKGATKKPKLSACLSLGFETDIQRPVSCLFHMHLHCFWRWQNLSACGTPLTVSKVPQFHVEQGCNIVICYSCHTKFRNHIS